jgi:SNF2 family DNA or RNA helicase
VTSIDTYLQANARVHRQGQANPTTVVHIEGSPVETKLYKMLQEKLDFHTGIIDLYRNEINT